MPGFAYKGRAGGQSRKAHRKLAGPQLMGERRGDVSRGHCVNETVRLVSPLCILPSALGQQVTGLG